MKKCKLCICTFFLDGESDFHESPRNEKEKNEKR